MSKGKRLSDKQLKFCEEYLMDLNATQAAIRAGYSKNYATAQGYKLLENVGVQKQIQKIQAELREKAKRDSKIASPEEILEEYTKIIRFDPRNLVDKNGNFKGLKDLDDDTVKVLKIYRIIKNQKELKNGTIIKKFAISIVWLDKLKAIISIAKILGLYEKNWVQKITKEAVRSSDLEPSVMRKALEILTNSQNYSNKRRAD